MDYQLQYDPRTKQAIKKKIFSFLYAPTQKEFKERLDNLIVKNTLLGGYSHQSFVYKGEFYSRDPNIPPRKANRLVPQLIPVMDAYLRDVNTLNQEEIPYTLGYINQVLNSTQSLQDYMRLLPAAVHRPLEEFKDRCPCHTKLLSDKTAVEIQEKNQHSINLIKQRMVKNLLI